MSTQFPTQQPAIRTSKLSTFSTANIPTIHFTFLTTIRAAKLYAIKSTNFCSIIATKLSTVKSAKLPAKLSTYWNPNQSTIFPTFSLSFYSTDQPAFK